MQYTMMVNCFLPVTAAVTLVNLVTAQGTDIEPARIYGSTSHVTAGQHFELKCSTYGLTKAEEQVFVYLCKNGVGLDRVATKNHDITFTVKSASLDHTGNYSCVFSRNKYSPKMVRGEGDTPVFIKVIDFLHPAVIAVVRQGADVKFRCTSKDAPDTNVLHAYLCKNQRITDVNLWDSVRKQAYFPIRRVQVQDSSNYSCVLSQKLLAPTDLGMCGSNTLYLKANDTAFPAMTVVNPGQKCNENIFRILCSVGVIIIAVVVLTSGRICQRKDEMMKSQDEMHRSVSISMVPLPFPMVTQTATT